jgi:hypothetical protein
MSDGDGARPPGGVPVRRAPAMISAWASVFTSLVSESVPARVVRCGGMIATAML